MWIADVSSMTDISLLSSVVVAALCDGEPVTYMTMTLRLHGFGGNRVCRRLVDEMKRAGYIEIQQCPMRSDLRTKAVKLTNAGRDALEQYASVVNQVVSARNQDSVRRRSILRGNRLRRSMLSDDRS